MAKKSVPKRTMNQAKVKKPGPQVKPKVPKPIAPRRKMDPAKGFIDGIKNKIFTNEEQRIKNSEAVNRRQRAKSASVRDIAPLPCWEMELDGIHYPGINWERRLACKESLKLFAETYLPTVFYLGWSQDQQTCVRKCETVIRDGGMFSLAMPRGGGKTAICRAALLWASCYAYRTFMYFIGATEDKGNQSLEFIKTYWYRNRLLYQDFPEIGHAVVKVENNFHKARGQLYNGEPTHIEWGTGQVRFPCLTLPKEVAEWYKEHDGDSVTWIADLGLWIPKQAGLLITTNGIEGSIRGDALIHPVTLAQPRPDLVLLDDIQKDHKADSPVQCEKMIRIVDGAVQGLAGPGKTIAALMPCTVIREGDVADTYLSTQLKPEWQGERCSMVVSWPEGITNKEITDSTEAGKLWNQYADLYRQSMRQFGDLRLARDLYAANREVMDFNFVCSWPDRYTKEGRHHELSAMQHAMNLRIKLGASFLSEYQNIGRKLEIEGEIMITQAQLETKQSGYPEFHVPAETQYIVAHLDVQMEIMFHSVFACDQDFNGVFTTYGVWPEPAIRYFTKDQTRSWSMMSSEFFKVYPKYRDKAIHTNEGHLRAPLDAKIYFGLQQAIGRLRQMTFIRQDEHKTPMKIGKISVDTRWGETSEVVKRYIKESGDKDLVPYYGQALPPTRRQFEEYEFRKGWLFEHQLHPNVEEPKWCIKPNPDGMFYMMADVDRLKDFLFARLSSPLGSQGCVSLYAAPPERHELFASHIANSEYPEIVSARGMNKNNWVKREGIAFDNDWLDCGAGCMAVASLSGASIKTAAPPRIVIRKLSEMRANAKKHSSRSRQ
jgi:hypothetical protein